MTVGKRAERYSSMTIVEIRDLWTEAEFQRAVVNLAKSYGWGLQYHTFDSRLSAKGFPDLVLCNGRRVVFAELKSARGKASEEQLAWLAALGDAGEEAFLWRPGDWDEIEGVLSGTALPGSRATEVAGGTGEFNHTEGRK